MHRLFVAIRPPVRIRSQLIAIMGAVDGARWQDDSHLHITLRFIGEVETHVAEDIALALQALLAAPFEVSLDGVGVFERKGRIDALWARLSHNDMLTALHKKVDQALARCGLEPEHRAYLPHITLARFGRVAEGVADFVARNAALKSTPFLAESFGLYESVIGKDGARYNLIARYPLEGRPSTLVT